MRELEHMEEPAPAPADRGTGGQHRGPVVGPPDRGRTADVEFVPAQVTIKLSPVN